MNTLLAELKRRNVFRVGVAYTVVAWLIIQVVDTLAPRMAMPEWVPGFAIILVLIGFPIALIFAWAFEITPEGLKKTAEVDATTSVTVDTGRKIDRMIITALALLVGLLLVDRFGGFGRADSSGAPGETAAASIAVLPFVNLSSDPEQEFFSDGISEELLNLLAQIPDLRVAARTSSFQFKGDNRDITDIGQQLNVGHVLEGSVRKSTSGLQVRITAQLINAEDGFHLWSDTYDRNLEDIFAVQDEISAAIVVALRDRLGLEVEAAPTREVAGVSSAAHEAYLLGRHLVVQRTNETVDGAIAEFEKAIALEPDYALAHAELAMAFNMLARSQYGTLTATEIRRRASPHAARALELAPDLAEAHAAAAYTEWGSEDFDSVLAGFERAISINPNYAVVHVWMGNLLDDDLGRYAEAFATRATALALDPLSLPGIANNARSLFDRGRTADAERELEKLASIAPAFMENVRAEWERRSGGWALGALGDLDALIISPSFARSRFFLSLNLAVLGLGQEAEAVFPPAIPFVFSLLGQPVMAVTAAEAAFAEEPESLVAERDVGTALAGVGNYDRARPILEEMWQRSDRRIAENGLFDPSTAAALIVMRRDSGNEAAVSDLLEAMDDHVRRYEEAGIVSSRSKFTAGVGAYLAGDRADGIRMMATAVDEGHFFPPNEAYLEGLYDDPGFAPIMAAQEVHQAQERAKFLAIVCTDNPYAAVWEPAPGTCAAANVGGQ